MEFLQMFGTISLLLFTLSATKLPFYDSLLAKFTKVLYISQIIQVFTFHTDKSNEK